MTFSYGCWGIFTGFFDISFTVYTSVTVTDKTINRELKLDALLQVYFYSPRITFQLVYLFTES